MAVLETNRSDLSIRVLQLLGSCVACEGHLCVILAPKAFAAEELGPCPCSFRACIAGVDGSHVPEGSGKPWAESPVNVFGKTFCISQSHLESVVAAEDADVRLERCSLTPAFLLSSGLSLLCPLQRQTFRRCSLALKHHFNLPLIREEMLFDFQNALIAFCIVFSWLKLDT